MPSTKSPRRLVLRNVKDQASPNIQTVSGATPSVQTGVIRLHSSDVPGLELGETYTAKFQQSITLPGEKPILNSQTQFKVSGSPYTLEPSLIDSVYPPPGHSDYWNVLPHVLFNNQQVPWLLNAQTGDQKTPWLALLVFTEDELTLTEDQKAAIAGVKSLDPTPTLANNLLVSELAQLNEIVAQPVPLADAADPTPIQTIFIQESLYSSLFGVYSSSGDSSARADQAISTPSVLRFKYMSHVRDINTNQMANLGGSGRSRYSATVSPRTGLMNLSEPTTAYAHLVSLSGIINGNDSNMALHQSKPVALVSLYSWSFTYLPSTSFSLENAFTVLRQNLQPLRSPDVTLGLVNSRSPGQTSADDWVKTRMVAGYTLLRYRCPTGEATIALQRGLLTPIKYEAVDFPPSDYGSDLAVIDENTGFLDLTFQLAWELGRVSSMADRAVSAALMRLRKDIHNKTLAQAKIKLDRTFISGPDVVQTLPNMCAAFDARLESNISFIPERWTTSDLGIGRRQTLSFQTPHVSAAYSALLHSAIGDFAKIAPAAELSATVTKSDNQTPIFNDTNGPPNSPDYALIFDWIMDRWALHGVPFSNLVADPGFIPN